MGRYRRYSDDDEDEKCGHKFQWFGNNRVLCDVLEDMRKILNTGSNVKALKGLLEEAQMMGNRMEAALSDQKDLLKLNEAVSKARKAYRKLEKEYKALEAKAKPLRPKEKVKSS